MCGCTKQVIVHLRSLDLRYFILTSFAPRHKILSQARKLVHTVLRISSNGRTTIMRSSRTTPLLIFWSKAPLKTLRNLRLGLRREPWPFQKFSWGLEIIEGGIKVREDVHSKQRRAVATWQGNMRKLACSEEMRKEKKRSLSRQNSVRHFFQVIFRTCPSRIVLLDIKRWWFTWSACS